MINIGPLSSRPTAKILVHYLPPVSDVVRSVHAWKTKKLLQNVFTVKSIAVLVTIQSCVMYVLRITEGMARLGS